MPCDEKQEVANLGEMVKQTESAGKASASIAGMIDYCKKGQPDKMASMDPKWSKKAGGGGGCVVL